MRALRTARKERAPARPAESSLKSKLAKLGIRTDFDLVLHLPLRYEDETVLTPIDAARHGAPALVEGEVVASDVAFRPRRQLVVQVRDSSGVLFARFLNFYQSQARALAPGVRVRLFGEVRPGFFGDEMVHPRYRVLRGPEPLPASLTPVYPTTAGLGQALLRKLIDEALARADLGDTLPEAIRAERDLEPFAPSVLQLHRPLPAVDPTALEARTHPAWRRMKFDELLAQQLSMRMHYRARRAQAAPPLATARRSRGATPGAAAVQAHARTGARMGRDRARPRRGPPDEPPPAGRRRQRQDDRRRGRGRARGRVRLAGGGDGADRDPRRAAPPQVRRMARAARLAGRVARRRAAGARAARRDRRRRRRRDPGRHRDARALPGEGRVRPARPCDRRRAAPLRRAAAARAAGEGQAAERARQRGREAERCGGFRRTRPPPAHDERDARSRARCR